MEDYWQGWKVGKEGVILGKFPWPLIWEDFPLRRAGKIRNFHGHKRGINWLCGLGLFLRRIEGIFGIEVNLFGFLEKVLG